MKMLTEKRLAELLGRAFNRGFEVGAEVENVNGVEGMNDAEAVNRQSCISELVAISADESK